MNPVGGERAGGEPTTDRKQLLGLLTSVGVAALLVGSVLDRFVGIEVAYVVSRAIALVPLACAVYVGVRGGVGVRSLLLPGVLLVLVVVSFVLLR